MNHPNTSNIKIKQEEEEIVDVTSSLGVHKENAQSPLNHILDVDVDNDPRFKKLDREYAIKKKFPPSCPVWYSLSSKNDSLDAYRGRVRSIHMDQEEDGLVYKIAKRPHQMKMNNEDSAVIVSEKYVCLKEDQLSYAMNCPVKVKGFDKTDPGKEIEGTIVCPNKDSTYSVMLYLDENNVRVELEVSADLINFRKEDIVETTPRKDNVKKKDKNSQKKNTNQDDTKQTCGQNMAQKANKTSLNNTGRTLKANTKSDTPVDERGARERSTATNTLQTQKVIGNQNDENKKSNQHDVHRENQTEPTTSSTPQLDTKLQPPKPSNETTISTKTSFSRKPELPDTNAQDSTPATLASKSNVELKCQGQANDTPHLIGSEGSYAQENASVISQLSDSDQNKDVNKTPDNLASDCVGSAVSIVNIHHQRSQQDLNEYPQKIQSSGDQEKTHSTQAHLNSALSTSRKRKTAQNTTRSVDSTEQRPSKRQKFPDLKEATCVLTVPSRVTKNDTQREDSLRGYLIGKGGGNVRYITSKTTCKLHVSLTRPVTIKISSQQKPQSDVMRAKELIEDSILDFFNGDKKSELHLRHELERTATYTFFT